MLTELVLLLTIISAHTECDVNVPSRLVGTSLKKNISENTIHGIGRFITEHRYTVEEFAFELYYLYKILAPRSDIISSCLGNYPSWQDMIETCFFLLKCSSQYRRLALHSTLKRADVPLNLINSLIVVNYLILRRPHHIALIGVHWYCSQITAIPVWPV